MLCFTLPSGVSPLSVFLFICVCFMFYTALCHHARMFCVFVFLFIFVSIRVYSVSHVASVVRPCLCFCLFQLSLCLPPFLCLCVSFRVLHSLVPPASIYVEFICVSCCVLQSPLTPFQCLCFSLFVFFFVFYAAFSHPPVFMFLFCVLYSLYHLFHVYLLFILFIFVFHTAFCRPALVYV